MANKNRGMCLFQIAGWVPYQLPQVSLSDYRFGVKCDVLLARLLFFKRTNKMLAMF